MIDQTPDWFGFWGQAVAAAIGASAAFLFTLWQARLQNERERRERQLERREIDILALKAAVDASTQNLEELLNYKAQTLSAIGQEADSLRAMIEKFAPTQAILNLAGKLPNFFQELTEGSFAAIPTSDKFSFAIDDAPGMTKFVHRAASTPGQFNKAVQMRNDLTRRWAEAARNIPTENDIKYFLPMLVSATEVMVSHVNV